jgi:hypothetical protein
MSVDFSNSVSSRLLNLNTRRVTDGKIDLSSPKYEKHFLNIKLRISKVFNEVEIAMPWLIDDLNDLKENFPRTIIYYGVIM